MSVEISMKMSPKQAGKLYVKAMQLEEEVDRLRDTLARVEAFKEFTLMSADEGEDYVKGYNDGQQEILKALEGGYE